MKSQSEINWGYLDHIRNLNRAGAQLEKGGASPQPAVRTSLPERWRGFRAWFWWVEPGIRITAAVSTAFLMEGWLRLYLFFKRTKPSELTNAALNVTASFAEQYPLHLYPVVCKAIELAWLERELPKLLNENSRTLEIAIGDGTLSARVFPRDAKVIALDLSPYSLKQASEKSHVRQAIVCDCMNPPVLDGSFDVLIANNFLHHVTNKEEVLSKWAKIADHAVFNENSPTWASGWAVPYLLAKFGRRKKAGRIAAQIEKDSLQSLESKTALDAHVTRTYDIVQCDSYMSERTFFYAAIFSFIMGCYGPPTPRLLKGLFLSRRLRGLILPLTVRLAKLLIRFDQFQDRTTDSFISYIGKSRNYRPARPGNYLACPDCRIELSETNRCTECDRKYSSTDGMLFLLPKELPDLQPEYSVKMASQIPKEHL